MFHVKHSRGGVNITITFSKEKCVYIEQGTYDDLLIDNVSCIEINGNDVTLRQFNKPAQTFTGLDTIHILK